MAKRETYQAVATSKSLRQNLNYFLIDPVNEATINERANQADAITKSNKYALLFAQIEMMYSSNLVSNHVLIKILILSIHARDKLLEISSASGEIYLVAARVKLSWRKYEIRATTHI